MWCCIRELFLQNSWLDKLYGVAVNFSPAIRMDLWKGAVLTGQVVLPVYTNMTDFRKYIRPGVITLRGNFVCRVVCWDGLRPETSRVIGWEWMPPSVINRPGTVVGGCECRTDRVEYLLWRGMGGVDLEKGVGFRLGTV